MIRPKSRSRCAWHYRLRASNAGGSDATRFPAPWSIEELTECFIVRDANGQALGYLYFDEQPHWRAVSKRLTKDEARRMVVNFAQATWC